MELNPNGTVRADSVRDIKRITLKLRESQTIKYRLFVGRRGAVRLGEIAVLGDREFIRVNPADFQGSAWIEIQ